MRTISKAERLRHIKKKENGIKAKTLKTKSDRWEFLKKIREKERDNSKKLIKESIHKTYGKWEPISDISRSFFVWKGNYSGSIKERVIHSILKSHNLRFYCEVSFDLKKRFDFYIPLLDLVIEYDGGQHFKYFKEIKNDIYKEDILKKLGVKLIRYNKTHDLEKQIAHDLIYHPVLNS